LEQGLLVARLTPGGAAERAGIRGPKIIVMRREGYEYRGVDRSKADLIVSVDGKPVKSLDDLLSYVESKQVGDKVVFEFIREGRLVSVGVILEQTAVPEKKRTRPQGSSLDL
jgi:S1-C subfamily serine protease